MDAVHSLSPKSFPIKPPPSSPPHVPVSLLRSRKSLLIRRADSSNSSSTTSKDSDSPLPPRVPPPITPPETVEIRFRRGSKKRRQHKQDGEPLMAQKSKPAPKKWEEMSLAEKAIELYVGENGMLFWLNKFAYASIFIMIGAWIVFRFVGPALNLYQLDTPPLSPAAVLKGP